MQQARTLPRIIFTHTDKACSCSRASCLVTCLRCLKPSDLYTAHTKGYSVVALLQKTANLLPELHLPWKPDICSAC